MIKKKKREEENAIIINTGSRTDIPAFYGEWFFNRVREGSVMTRNPYFPEQITKYRLSPDVVDVLAFCTKNPAPMLPRLAELKDFRQFWFVTVTPYGRDIEPGVPDKESVMEAFKELSKKAGRTAVSWRYDPVFLSEAYPMDFHKETFAEMAANLAGHTDQAVVSFIDLYEKTKRNFPEVREVFEKDQIELVKSFAKTGKKYGMTVRLCFEKRSLGQYGADTEGCMTKTILERAVGEELAAPKGPGPRPGCGCLLGNDIGAYNTCRHFCRYCYANYDRRIVRENARRHDPNSPLLVGEVNSEDTIHEAKQKSWRTGQRLLF